MMPVLLNASVKQRTCNDREQPEEFEAQRSDDGTNARQPYFPLKRSALSPATDLADHFGTTLLPGHERLKVKGSFEKAQTHTAKIGTDGTLRLVLLLVGQSSVCPSSSR